MSTKQDQGLNIMLLGNEMNRKQYFYISGRWETYDGNERLIRSSWTDMKLVIRNMASYITTLGPEAKERLASIHNYLPKPTP